LEIENIENQKFNKSRNINELQKLLEMPSYETEEIS